MTIWQKTIKYIAIAFAILLIVGIIVGILSAFGVFTNIFRYEVELGEMQIYQVSDSITDIKMEIGAANFTIVVDDEFYVESNLRRLTVKEKNGCLFLSERKSLFKNSSKTAVLNLYIPEGFVFDDVEIETGAGQVTVDILSSNKLRLELGAGEVNIGELNADYKAEIEGGAGSLTIKGGKLCDLDLDMGVGELNLTSRLMGENELNYGIGAANLVLIGSADDYRIDVDRGLGKATLEGEEIKNDSVYGTGETEVDIDGGVGEITVRFMKGMG